MSEQRQHDKQKAHRRLVKRLRRQAQDVARLISGVEEESLARRVIPDKWSLKELVCHLWRVQQVFAGRVETMLGEDNPAFVSYGPEGDPEFEKLVSRPAVESQAGFLADRERLEEWHRMGRHPACPWANSRTYAPA